MHGQLIKIRLQRWKKGFDAAFSFGVNLLFEYEKTNAQNTEYIHKLFVSPVVFFFTYLIPSHFAYDT